MSSVCGLCDSSAAAVTHRARRRVPPVAAARPPRGADVAVLEPGEHVDALDVPAVRVRPDGGGVQPHRQPTDGEEEPRQHGGDEQSVRLLRHVAPAPAAAAAPKPFRLHTTVQHAEASALPLSTAQPSGEYAIVVTKIMCAPCIVFRVASVLTSTIRT